MFVHLVPDNFLCNKVAIAYESEMLEYIRDISILGSFHGIISLGLDPNRPLPLPHCAPLGERSISTGGNAPVRRPILLIRLPSSL